jgi:hypothetical protein
LDRSRFGTWDEIFGRRYIDTTFYRQSLQIQYLFAELYHEATALRGIAGPEDVSKMPETQRQVVERAIHSARKGGILLDTGIVAAKPPQDLRSVSAQLLIVKGSNTVSDLFIRKQQALTLQ